MTIKHWNNTTYQISGATILCNADKEGCDVFEINGQMGQLRVLAHDRQEAVEAYREEMYGDPDYCEECGGYGVENCDCEPDSNVKPGEKDEVNQPDSLKSPSPDAVEVPPSADRGQDSTQK